jgi:hypothetical protein
MLAILWREVHNGDDQVVLDAKLLKATDNAAKRRNVNRSALIRQALGEHLKRLRLLILRSATDAVIRLNRNESRNIFPGRMQRLGWQNE